MDINGDSNVDIIIGATDGKIHLYTGDGTGKYSSSGGLPLATGGDINIPNYTMKPALTDWDGDGLCDVILGQSKTGVTYDSYPILFYKNIGTEQSPLFSASEILSAQGNAITGIKASAAVGDLDGDGLKDLVVSQHDGDARFYKNIGTVDNPVLKNGESLTIWNEEIQARFPYLNDYYGNYNELKQMLTTGRYWVNFSKRYLNTSLVDYNNDGKLDMLFGFGGWGGTPGTIDGIDYHNSFVHVAYDTLNAVSLLTEKLENINEIQLTKSGEIKLDFITEDEIVEFSIFSINGKKIISKEILISSDLKRISLNLEHDFAVGYYLCVLELRNIKRILPFIVD